MLQRVLLRLFLCRRPETETGSSQRKRTTARACVLAEGKGLILVQLLLNCFLIAQGEKEIWERRGDGFVIGIVARDYGSREITGQAIGRLKTLGKP